MKEHRPIKIELVVKRKKLRLAVWERLPDGKYKPLDRPRTEADLTALKLAAKGMTMLARGVSDVPDIEQTVRKSTRTLRRRKSKLRPESPSEATI